jgi:hypothetical protein
MLDAIGFMLHAERGTSTLVPLSSPQPVPWGSLAAMHPAARIFRD